jgi:hypothetical protein
MLTLENGTCRNVRLGFRNVGERVSRLKAVEAQIEGQTPSERLFSAAASAAMKAVEPPSDLHADADYRALVAWNCSTEQARTIAFAMPILRRASRVVVLTVEGAAAVPGPTGQQLCHYLQLSGVPAKPLTVGLNGRLTGEAIVQLAGGLRRCYVGDLWNELPG